MPHLLLSPSIIICTLLLSFSLPSALFLASPPSLLFKQSLSSHSLFVFAFTLLLISSFGLFFSKFLVIVISILIRIVIILFLLLYFLLIFWMNLQFRFVLFLLSYLLQLNKFIRLCRFLRLLFLQSCICFSFFSFLTLFDASLFYLFSSCYFLCAQWNIFFFLIEFDSFYLILFCFNLLFALIISLVFIILSMLQVNIMTYQMLSIIIYFNIFLSIRFHFRDLVTHSSHLSRLIFFYNNRQNSIYLNLIQKKKRGIIVMIIKKLLQIEFFHLILFTYSLLFIRSANFDILIFLSFAIQRKYIMSQNSCYGCLNPQLDQFKLLQTIKGENNLSQLGEALPQKQNDIDSASLKVTFKVELQSDKEQEQQSAIFFYCKCCGNNYCRKCCKLHLRKLAQNLKKKEIQGENLQNNIEDLCQDQNTTIITRQNISVVCQQCQNEPSVKYCQNCQQFLCQKCSFKIHNKGKRAKHELDADIGKLIIKRCAIIMNKQILNHLKQLYGSEKKTEEAFRDYVVDQLRQSLNECLFLIEDLLEKELCLDEQAVSIIYVHENIKLQDLKASTSKYPLLDRCKIILVSKDYNICPNLTENQKNTKQKYQFEIIQEFRRKVPNKLKHERVNSDKFSFKHNKNISNFSNLSAISKVQNQSVISNEPQSLFDSQDMSLNITLNQNSSILMMGALSDRDKQEKQQKKVQPKDGQKHTSMGYHGIYSIREENSHNSANNMSTSTENSIRKRNKKWPIPYFQPFRVPKYVGGSKHNAQLYLRDLAEKGILMIRREKAQQIILDPDLSRSFVRNIGQKQIEYVAYIIDFLSVQCLTWVIESIKQDKMTPSQKLIQSRLKQSFDLKINMKLWDSIIKYLQSPQYDQDYFENTKIRYVPKICIVKYVEQFLLQFEERKWHYEDQDLLDQEEQQWNQFKKLITDYFNGKSQITGGRYGCVQFVKLNGPKPLRKCSLGKLSMYVQEAINKGIIRYHKTLLVSNSENNNSMCSTANGIITNVQQLAQFQKDLKIMALQAGLIEMFLQSPPNTPISMAQIPLNLKSKIFFDYNLVELGFPKLKNLLATLNDKLILQSTKTHTIYQTTTNGLQAIQKLNGKLTQAREHYLNHILTFLNLIITHFQRITLEDLYSQLTLKLGFPFDYKLFNVPDFSQFAIYYCPHIITLQLAGNIFVATSAFPSYVYHHPHQTHRTTYSQDQYPTYNGHYNILQPQQYSRTTQKKNSQFYQPDRNNAKMSLMVNDDFQSFGYPTSGTPKFNNGQKKGNHNIWGDSYGLNLKKEDRIAEYEDILDDKMMQESINNILDDCAYSASHPKTVIVNDGADNNKPNQLYIDKNPLPEDENDSFSYQDYALWGNQGKTGKKEHLRVKSTIQTASKHSRVYSITTQPHK